MDLVKSKYTIADFKNAKNKDLGYSDWLPVTQKNIDQFGIVTHDSYWIHTDPDRVEAEGVYDTTIAHGFWTLSLLTYFNNQMDLWPENTHSGVNYGLNKVRWMGPFPIGSRIRNHVILMHCKKRGENRYVATFNCTIEVEGIEKPAMIAEWLGMIITKPN